MTKIEKKFLKKNKPWGIILFSRNIKNITQLKALISEIKKILHDKNYPILIDQEGGKVSRLDKIINNEAKAGKIYQLYKAHKPEKNYPRRTVASVCGAAIEHMSNWLEFYLAPVAKECKYRLEDTNIINKLEEFNSNSTAGELQEAIHVSWDITAMFPNLDNESGVEVCRERLNDREIKHPSTECIIEAIVITLENNVSKFEDKVVRQECGAAIGPAHICSYADIIVDKK